MEIEAMSADDIGISMDDVIVFRVSERHCKIAPPKEGDPPEVVGLKNFIMACLHRRNLDDSFEDEMRNWLNGFTLDEFKKAVEKRSPPSRKN